MHATAYTEVWIVLNIKVVHWGLQSFLLTTPGGNTQKGSLQCRILQWKYSSSASFQRTMGSSLSDLILALAWQPFEPLSCFIMLYPVTGGIGTATPPQQAFQHCPSLAGLDIGPIVGRVPMAATWVRLVTASVKGPRCPTRKHGPRLQFICPRHFFALGAGGTSLLSDSAD